MLHSNKIKREKQAKNKEIDVVDSTPQMHFTRTHMSTHTSVLVYIYIRVRMFLFM